MTWPCKYATFPFISNFAELVLYLRLSLHIYKDENTIHSQLHWSGILILQTRHIRDQRFVETLLKKQLRSLYPINIKHNRIKYDGWHINQCPLLRTFPFTVWRRTCATHIHVLLIVDGILHTVRCTSQPFCQLFFLDVLAILRIKVLFFELYVSLKFCEVAICHSNEIALQSSVSLWVF